MKKQVKKQTLPSSSRVLIHLFLTEMWERFSYYGVNSLLILYLSHQWRLLDSQTYLLYGAYGALVYATAVLGGLISDYYWGPYYSVLIGGWLLIIGHFILMCSGAYHVVFFLGLAVIILGTGLFKPSINTLVASLSSKQGYNRQQGFILTYIGSNVGTVMAPIISSIVALYWGWHAAFGLAGVGMLAGLMNFKYARAYFPRVVRERSSPLLLKPIGFMVLALLVLFEFLMHARWVGYGLGVVIFVTVFLLWRILSRASYEVKKSMRQALILLCFYIVFMVLLQQSGGALNLFTDRFINKHIWGFIIPTGMYQSVEPLALISLSSLFLWRQKRFKVKASLNYSSSFMRALGLMGLSFLVLVFGLMMNYQHTVLSMTWINVTYILQAAGEVFIGPIGLAMLSERIPQQHLGLFMGTWVLASALANFVAAKVGALTALPLTLMGTSLSIVFHQYSLVFSLMGLLGIGAAIWLGWLGRQQVL